MAFYNYKGYIVSIEQDPVEDGFRGSIDRNGIRYSVFKPVIIIKHKQRVNNGSWLFPKWEDEVWDEKLYPETIEALKKEFKTIIDGIECFMVGERNEITREFKEREDMLKSTWIEIRDRREEK